MTLNNVSLGYAIKKINSVCKLFLMNKKLLFLLSFFVYLTVSCEYNPKRIYEKDIDDMATPPEIDVVYLDLAADKDTITLLYNRVHFNFESSGQDVQRVLFYVNDSLIGSEESDIGYYDIQHHFISSGYHKLRLEIFTHSGTGSIADSLGVEGFIFSTKEWTVKVLDSEYTYVTSIVEDGFLKLRWDGKHVDAEEFVIYRSDYEIGRTTENSFIHKGYVGEGGKYRVYYIDSKTGEMENYGWVHIAKEIQIKYTADKNNNYYIEWDTPKYYAAVDYAVLFISNGSLVTRDTIADVNSLKYSIPRELFGNIKDYWLMFIPKYYNPYYEAYINPNVGYTFPSSERIECMIGYPFPICDYFSRINASEILYHTKMYDYGSTAHNDSVFRYSIVENKILSSYRYIPPGIGWYGNVYWYLSSSPDGQHFAATINFDKTLMYCSTNDFSDYKIIENQEFINSYQSEITNISNTETGIVFTNAKMYLFDFISEVILDEIEFTKSMDAYNISFDGQYLYLTGGFEISLYSIDNGTMVLEEEISNISSPGYEYFDFHRTEANTLVAWDEDTRIFSILSCPELDVLNSFSVPEDEIVDVDYYSNMILSFSPNLFVVRSLENSELLYEIPNTFTMLLHYHNFQIFENSIFYGKGARYFLY